MTKARVTTSLGLVIAVAAPIAIASSLRDGLVLAVAMSAGPIAALAPMSTTRLVATIGGGMVIAGLATTPGGNIIGLVMAGVGVLILAGVKEPPTIDIRFWGLSVTYVVGFVIGMFTALSGASALATVAVAMAIVGSTMAVGESETQE